MFLKIKFSTFFIMTFCLIASPHVAANFTDIFPKSNNILHLSHVLNDIATEFLVKQKIEFKVALLRTSSKYLKDVVNEFISKSEAKFRIVCSYIVLKVVYVLYGSHFLFYESLMDYEDTDDRFHIIRKENEPIMYFIFIQNLTYSDL